MNTTISKYISLLAVSLALLFATTPLLSAQTCTNPPAGLVGWWPGDGHFFDLVGARHGTPAGGTTFAAGKVAQGFNFDGNNQSVTIAYAPVLDVPPTGFTVEFWMRAGKDQVESASSIVDKDHNGGGGDYSGWEVSCWRDTGRLSFGIGDGSSFPLCTNTSDVLDGQFHHVAFAWDRTNWLIYVDGVLENSLYRPTVVNNTRPLRFGFHWGGAIGTPMRFFKGVLDEVGLYHRALAPAEIAAIHTAGSAGKCKPSFPMPAGLVSWWPGENSANDIVGPNSTTPVGAVGYAPGLVGNAFHLSGGFFEAPWSPSLYCNWGETTMSVEGWIFPYNIDLPFHVCGMRDDTYGRSSWQIAYDPTWPPPPVGVWTHVALTVGVSATPGLATLRYYENGVVKQATDTWNWTGYSGPNTNTPLRIGTSASWRPFIGLIDELSYYNRVLTTNEVAAIYAAGSAGKAPPPTLAVSLTSGNVLLSWPASAGGFGLVSRTTLTVGTWETVTNEPALNGNRKEVLLPANTRAQRFFRLQAGN